MPTRPKGGKGLRKVPPREGGLVQARRGVLIALFATGASWKEVERQTGLTAGAISKRLKDQQVQREITAIRAALFSRTLGGLADAGSEAVAALRGKMNDPEATDMAVVQAAKAVLEHGVKLRESVELAERVSELEAKLLERKAGGVSQIGPGASCDIPALTAGVVVDADPADPDDPDDDPGADDPTDAEIENEPDPPEAA